ncbi:hypothetical protein WNZ14_23515 [Hoeflea sp. AS60]|uniref:hypothetical protein n=1 Tax=Hoeflea sp. AS60 TaxID=3135780 RepID=UPI00317ABD3E
MEFVNRDGELDFLQRCLEKVKERPALVVVRSPAGFGKSTLTDRLINSMPLNSKASCVVDPSVRGRVGAISLHEGFFLQRIAESLDRTADLTGGAWPTLAGFLKARRKDAVLTKNPLDVVSEMPSLKHAYKVVFDYAARALLFGRYASEKLLISDQADAVAICAAYTEYVLRDHALILIVREVQHIDLQSLRTLLLLVERGPGPDLVFEYTAETGRFEPEHHKLLFRAAERRPGIDILDLVRLSADHLEYLIRTSVLSDFDLTSDYYLSWDGNLRSIVELKFGVGVGQSLTDVSRIGRTLANLSDTISEHIAQLPSLQRLLLSIIQAHVEAIDLPTLSSAAMRIDPRALHSEIGKALDQLEDQDAFLVRTHGLIALRNDTIAKSLQQTPAVQGLLALSEKALRDNYAGIMEGELGTQGLSNLLRQYFRLCARTKDMQGLKRAADRLTGEVRATQDHTIYVDAVASAIEANPELFRGEHDDLVEWAAELAYSASDWRRATTLLSLLKKRTSYSELMRACALQESGGHVEALQIIATLRCETADIQTLLAADLVEALVVGCRGEHGKTREILEAITANEAYRTSPLVGYAYRFFEIVDGLEGSLKSLKASVAWFHRHNLPESMAYSQLPAALLMARSGDIDGARTTLGQATIALSQVVRDQHIVVNNACAVELLSEQPDFRYCSDELSGALRFARDDFSELTILSNLSIALLSQGNLESAVDSAEKCHLLLANHDFADTDIYWPVCFNMAVVYAANGDTEKYEAARRFPFDNGPSREDDLEYWQYRYGLADLPPDTHQFLGGKPWHPVYLSHWLIDLEGLSLLK